MISQLDDWKIMGLGFTFILISNGIFVFYYFINKIYHSKEFKSEILPFYGLAFLFLFISISYIFSILYDFYRWQYGVIILFYSVLFNGLYISGLGITIFVFEYVTKKTKYFISLYIIIGTILISLIPNLELINLYLVYFLASAIAIIIIFQYFVFIKRTSGFLKQRMYISLSALTLWIIGSILRNDLINNMFGYLILSIGTILVTTGLLLMGYGFSAFSTFTDLNWKDKLHQFFIITKEGLCIYAYSFENNQTIPNSELLGAGFSSIQIFLSEILKTKDDLRIIEYKNLNVILEIEQKIIFVLVIKEKSSFLQYKLKKFSERFSDIFKESLKKWNGDLVLFYPTKNLIQTVFELDK